MESETYLNSLELEDKYTKCPTTWELAQVFQDSRDMVRKLVYGLEQELKFYDEWIAKEPFNENFKKVDPRYIRVCELKKFLNFTKPSVKGRIDRSDIERAKCVPIQDLYDFLGDRNKKFCPFHRDIKNPNFHIYEKSNRYKCFGCNETGDSISFIMKLQGIDFITAVKKLGGTE
jgi:hypothetical protein